MPAEAIPNGGNPVTREGLVIFDHKAVVLRCSEEVEPPPVAASMAGAFEAAEKKALKQLKAGLWAHFAVDLRCADVCASNGSASAAIIRASHQIRTTITGWRTAAVEARTLRRFG